MTTDDGDVDTDATDTATEASRVISDRRTSARRDATRREREGEGEGVRSCARHSARFGWGEPERTEVTGFSQCRTPFVRPDRRRSSLPFVSSSKLPNTYRKRVSNLCLTSRYRRGIVAAKYVGEVRCLSRRVCTYARTSARVCVCVYLCFSVRGIIRYFDTAYHL